MLSAEGFKKRKLHSMYHSPNIIKVLLKILFHIPTYPVRLENGIMINSAMSNWKKV